MKAKELKAMAAGRWESIIARLAPQLVQAIERAPHHVPCPVHGGVDGFRLFKDFNDTGGGVCNTCGIKHDGYALLMWANGWDFKTTHSALQDMLLVGGINSLPPVTTRPVVKKAGEADVEDIRDSLNRVWKNSVILSSPEARPARLYFANRGIPSVDYRKVDSNMIRFVPFLEYYEDGNLVNKYPAIVTMVCDANGRPSTIHRTYITHEGTKAPVHAAKKMMRHCAEDLFGAMQIAVTGKSKGVGGHGGYRNSAGRNECFRHTVMGRRECVSAGKLCTPQRGGRGDLCRQRPALQATPGWPRSKFGKVTAEATLD